MTDSSVRESVVMSFDLKTSLQRPSGKALGLARRVVFVCTVGPGGFRSCLEGVAPKERG